MSRQYKRFAQLTVEGSSGALNLSSLRIKFEVKQVDLQTPNSAVMRIYNVSEQSANRFLNKEFKKVTLDAGYEDSHGIIFSGDIFQTRKGRESPTDTFVDIFAKDGYKVYTKATISKTLKAGSTHKDHLDAFMAEMKPYGVTLGRVPDLGTKVYARAVSFFGDVKDHMRTLASQTNHSWSILNGKLVMSPKGITTEGPTVVLNSKTGMIGRPEQTEQGIMVRCLLNQNIRATGTIQIDESSILKSAQSLKTTAIENDNAASLLKAQIATDGIYKVYVVDFSGDTHGPNWYSNITCTSKENGASIYLNTRALPQAGEIEPKSV